MAKQKILIVDDDKFLLDMYAGKFKQKDFEVTAVTNSQEAYTKLEEGLVPDVLALDIIMPGFDGIELLEKIREKNFMPNAIVVMLTNQSDAGDIARAKKLGIHGYIVKATSIPSEVVSQVMKIIEENK
jgi:CheY-like chemotaxis protein